MVENKVQLPMTPSTEVPADGIKSMIGGKEIVTQEEAQKQKDVKPAEKELTLDQQFLTLNNEFTAKKAEV